MVRNARYLILTMALILGPTVLASMSYLTAQGASASNSQLQVTINQPQRGSTVLVGPISVNGLASTGSVPIKSIYVRIDNNPYVHATTSVSGTVYSWSVSGLSIASAGRHVVVVKATDMQGTRAYSISRFSAVNQQPPVSAQPQTPPPVTSNPPTVTTNPPSSTNSSVSYPSVVIMSPTSGSMVNSSTLTVTGSANEVGGGNIQKVEVQLNGSAYQEATPKSTGDWSTWQMAFNMSSQPVGHYTLQARVTDNAGKQNWTQVQFDYSLYDDFASYYTLTPSFKSPNGKWFGVWNGAGSFGTAQVDGRNVFFEHSNPVTSPTDSQSALSLSTQQFKNFNLTVDVTTHQQTRLNTPPNSWEVGWIIWHWNDNTHFNYFVVKTDGAETGKYDGGVNPVDQKILQTSTYPQATIGKPMHWNISVQDGHIVISVDGLKVFDFYDTSSFDSGTLGLYSEDSSASFCNLNIVPK